MKKIFFFLCVFILASCEKDDGLGSCFYEFYITFDQPRLEKVSIEIETPELTIHDEPRWAGPNGSIFINIRFREFGGEIGEHSSYKALERYAMAKVIMTFNLIGGPDVQRTTVISCESNRPMLIQF